MTVEQKTTDRTAIGRFEIALDAGGLALVQPRQRHTFFKQVV